MERSAISNWIRQARHRAKHHDIYSELVLADVEEIVDHYQACAYCGGKVETLDHAFPLRDMAPNVAANVLPSCKECKRAKRNNNIVWMYNNNSISKKQYISILEDLLQRPGATILREHVKAVTGLSD